MIPEHLKGQSSVQIFDDIMLRNLDVHDKELIHVMSSYVHMAILHALCACDGAANEPNAAGRAIAFLNTVAPPAQKG